MCTIALLPGHAGHFILAGNRDELRTRKRALPPQNHDLDGVRALFPVDANAHGTWIGANEYGFAATLLNHYPRQAVFTPADPVWSRGQLMRAVLGARDLDAAQATLTSLEPRLPHVNPFRLVLATPTGAAYVVWDGEQLERTALSAPAVFVSSSFEEPRARAARLHALSSLQEIENYAILQDPQQLVFQAFAQATPRPGPFTVSMARPDACSVSHTFLEVTPAHISMSYHDGAPHEPGGTRHDVRIERAR